MKIKNKYIFFLLILLIQSVCSANSNQLIFSHACAKGQPILITAVGDVLLHMPLQQKGKQKGFDSLWQAAIPYIKAADIAYANLEGPIAPNSSTTGFPTFNYPASLADALKNSGFDIVSTANNHALDRFSNGVNQTIATLQKNNLAHVGTRTQNENPTWVQIIKKNGVNVAWIACAEHTNGINDSLHQVLHCYRKEDKTWILQTIQDLKNKVDAIIVAPHWGEQYQTKPNSEQVNFAHQVLNAGATAIIGSHPHVLQPLEKYVTTDGRETLIMYSLGNFVSYQGTLANRSTVILLIGLTKTTDGTIINGVRFVPMYMQNRSGIDAISLTPVSNDNSEVYHVISQVMPMGNALYSDTIVTNPQCKNN